MPYPFSGLGFNSWAQKFSRGNISAAAAAAFLQYVTTGSTSSFTLRSTGTVDYEVDWGDGSTESLTTNTPTHTYSSAGEYTIKITPAEGSTYRPYFINNVSGPNIKSISGTGGSQLGTNLLHAWYGASNMTSFSGGVDTSSATNFGNTWRGCSSLTSFPSVDVSSGTSFIGTWQSCSGLTSFPALNTSSADSFSSTWSGCSSLTSFPVLDASNVTIFASTWRGCSGLTAFPLINTSSGTNFNNTWRGCSGLTSFPALDFSSGTSFGDAWRECSNLVEFPSVNFSSATTFRRTWIHDGSLTTYPADQFDTTGTLASGAFSQAWQNCALTAQSIENILTSLDTNGAQNITLDINGGTNAAKTTWSAAANTAYTNLINKGWTISYNA